MDTYPDILEIGRLIGDLARSSILVSLLDGRPRAAGELAALARISPQAASSHLAKLVEGGLLSVLPSGRHRYYRLMGPEVAQALEALARIAPPPRVRSLRTSSRLQSLTFARSCYDHLAGVLGVALAEALVKENWLVFEEGAFHLTGQGASGLGRWGIDTRAIARSKRPLTRSCLDWSERKPHLSGALGAALLAGLLDLGWVKRTDVPRMLALTEKGRLGLLESLGLDLPGA